ncbi:hypothetical protein P691DRAFT_188745 [Macrolepiota fuliginosa MF-IS2]|uniref:HNH nuclease domain-containing protein n=1 Tax=Macrolepiota fuliginosa MF-IS2 TaxID=1400762 RepID=A0A9P6C263_9AGAR|nr:hypothetical protein P691DRAFT_188745 [Macrolepiota fuliginosa MF-IS2]
MLAKRGSSYWQKAIRTEPSSNQTPTFDDTAARIENTTRAQQSTLRSQVASRERFRCPITRSFCNNRKKVLQNKGLEVPGEPYDLMETAHIIPSLLNKFDPKTNPAAEAAHTWDMFRSWTNLDLEKFVGSKINTPANAIYMEIGTHRHFGHFGFYLDKDAFPSDPNKYGLRVLDSFKMFNNSMVVDFATTNDLGEPIDPPDPELLRIHAALAQVLHISGAADYLESVERVCDDYGTLAPTGETDIGLLLSLRLP